MATRAFLLCGDEKAVHAVTQILDELEVSFEQSSEPAFALKRLASQRFELLVVDCDNAQNATQVFNSARASQLNKASIAIAIVEGKAGVPNAFRLGASLVLTKPVSLEQARNTLRTGIGMARKDTPEAKHAASAVPPASSVIPLSPLVPAPPVPSVSAPTSSGPAPAVTTPAAPAPSGLTPVPISPLVVSPATPKPPATFAPVAPPAPVSVAPAGVVPVSEKPTVVPKPAVTSTPPQEHKTALTDFTVPDEAAAKPKLAVTAPVVKAAAASASSVGTATLEPVRKETASPSTASQRSDSLKTDLQKPASQKTASQNAALPKEDAKAKSKPALVKSDAAESDIDEAEELQDAELSVSDPLAEEESLDPLKDYGVPSFGGLGTQPFARVEKPKRSGGKGWLIAATVLALIGGGGYAAWITQSAFRDFATSAHGNVMAKIAEYRGEPQTAAAAKPHPTPPPAPVPAPAPAAAPAAPTPGSEDIDLSLGPASPSSTATPDVAGSTAGSSPAANSPQVSDAVADGKTQKSAAVQSARQDANHTAANPALVPASLPPATAKAPSSDLFEVPEDFADDLVVHRVHPVYPKQARVRKVQGTVVLQAIVSKEGKVDSLQLVSGDPTLASAAAAAVKQWRYKPYLHNGDYTDFQTRVTVDFKLP